MNPVSALENGLFALSQVMRVPVIALLWVCIAAALFMAGSCAAEFLRRRRERTGFDINQWILDGPTLKADPERLRQLPTALRGFVMEVAEQSTDEPFRDGGLEHIVLEREESARRALNGSRLLIRVGPSLGLLGTLIPMGTALASLTAGNLEVMAGQMVVAFTTTIVGLTAGTAGYVIQVIRQSWVNEGVREQRFLAERIAGELEREAS